MRLNNCKFAKDSLIRASLFKGSLMCGKIIGNRYFRQFHLDSTKTIRLFALDFYEAIADSAFSLINYHFIEILSS